MSGKSKKNKAPEAEVPKDDNVPVEDFDDEFVEETAAVETVPEKGRGRADAADPKKKKSKRGFRMPSVDPIILGSFLVFLIACLVVSGVTIYGAMAGETTDKTAEFGDNVKVYYTGSYYAYYDQEGALIFDTNMSDVGDSEDYKKSWGYINKTEYETFDFAIGTYGENYPMPAFQDSVIGHKVGDRFTVVITDGYGSLVEDVNYFKDVNKNSGNIKRVQENVTVNEYTSFFGSDSIVPETGFPVNNIDSPYGWKANVIKNANGTLTIEYNPTAGETYTSFGVSLHVSTVGETIAFEYQTGDNFDLNAKMIKTAYDGKIVYIIQSGETTMSYKNSDNKGGETIGTVMYFVIELAEISE